MLLLIHKHNIYCDILFSSGRLFVALATFHPFTSLECTATQHCRGRLNTRCILIEPVELSPRNQLDTNYVVDGDRFTCHERIIDIPKEASGVFAHLNYPVSSISLCWLRLHPKRIFFSDLQLICIYCRVGAGQDRLIWVDRGICHDRRNLTKQLFRKENQGTECSADEC